MPTAAKHNSKRSRSSIRVLVVDDFHPFANVLVNLLEANFYDARAGYSATQALDIAEEFNPHVVIADVVLPDMHGAELAAKFNKRYPNCRVLLMSAGKWAVPKNVNGLRLVPKELVREEAFRFLEACRWSVEL